MTAAWVTFSRIARHLQAGHFCLYAYNRSRLSIILMWQNLLPPTLNCVCARVCVCAHACIGS